MKFFLNSLKLQFQCFLFLLTLIQSSFEYLLSGNTLTDLTSTDLAGFTTEAGGWTLSSYRVSGVKISTCVSDYILGGYAVLGGSGPSYPGQYYETKYTSLPTHNQINLSMKIYALDSWDANTGVDDYFTISFDGYEYFAYAIMRYSGTYSHLCGNPSNFDYPPFIMKVTYPHIDSALTLRITSHLDADSIDASVGFRDIRIDFVYQDKPQRTLCGISPQMLPDKPCPCSATNQYMFPIRSGTCFDCDPTCATCSGGLSTNCLSCYDGNTYFKDSQCLTCDWTCATCDGGAWNQCTSCITHYFMVEGSCYPTCDSPLTHYEIADITYCKTPCPNEYAYWDNTCSTACPHPLLPKVVSSFGLCTFPCPDSEYLYWNRTCSINCDPPYEIVVDHNRKFCVFPCTASEYVYWDNTCETTCNPPLVKYSMGSPIVKDFCAYPCEFYEYVYWNGTCSDTCDAPLVAKTDHDRQFCVYPCLLTKYLYFNGSCLDSCPTPFTLRVEDARAYCDYGCIDTLEYLYWNGECGSCDAPLVRRIEAGKKYCDFQCDATAFVYWDGSCDTTCSPPLTRDPQGDPITRNFCNFPCDLNQFLYWNETCSDSCVFPFVQRTFKGKKFCDYPCDTSEYSYWNGTCQSDCPLPFLNRFEGNPARKYCDYPCSDSTYLFWNDTCDDCQAPLVRRVTAGKNYCDFPCDEDEYLYWEGSCNSTCAFPLTEDIQGEIVTRKFCYFPCLETQYLYWNGSCSYYCDFPYIIGGAYDHKTCNYPCLVEEYSYYNGTCMSSCELPLSYRNESNRNYCDYPCKTYEFLAWDGTCLDFCEFPYVTLRYDGLQFCRLPCYADYFYFPDSMICNETCTYPYYNNTDLPYMRCYPPVNPDYGPDFLEAPMNPGTVSFITLSKMMQYLRYLNLNLPPRLERLALSQGRPILSTSAGIQPGEEVKKFFERFESLDGIYSRHGFKQSFLANYWNTLITILIFALAGIVLWIFEQFLLLIEFQRWALILERIRVMMKFNFPIMILAYSIDEVILFAYFEFTTLSSRSYSSVSSTVSFLVCLLIVVSIPGLACLTYYIIRRNRFYEAQVAARQDTVSKDKGEGRIPDGYRDLNVKKIRFESFQVLYRGFKEDNIFNQMFFSIYILRIGLPIIIAICCENKPLVCCFLQLLINVAIVSYLFWMKPFKKQVNHYQIMIYELGVLLLNLCVGLITLIRVSNSSYPLASKALATSVLAGNGLLNILLLIFLVIKCVLEIIAIYEEMEKQGIQGVRKGIAFLQVPFLYLQEGNMGFEEIINYQPYSQVPKRRAIFAAHAITSENSFFNYESFRGLNTSHRELNVSYSGDQSTIIEALPTKPDLRTETEEDESVIALPALPFRNNNNLRLSPKEEEEEEKEIEIAQPMFEEMSRPRKKSLIIESPSKERKEWEEETIPKIKREGIKRKPLRKQLGGLDFRNLNF